MKNGNSRVKLHDDVGVDDYDKVKSMNNMPSHFGSYILPHSKRLVNEVIDQIGGFYINSFHYGDTDSTYFPRKYWSSIVEIGFVVKSLGLRKNDNGNSGFLMYGFWLPK